MNDARRKELTKANALLDEALEIISACRDDEQEYLDSMPENMQQAEKGQKAEEAVAALDEAVSNLEEAAGNIETARE